MKTKKEILDWFVKLELNKEIYDYKDDLPVYNDRKSFYDNIDKSIKVDEKNFGLCKDSDIEVMFLSSKRWKYPLELYWSYTECIKIAGF